MWNAVKPASIWIVFRGNNTFSIEFFKAFLFSIFPMAKSEIFRNSRFGDFYYRKSAEIEILTKIRISPSENRENILKKKVFAKDIIYFILSIYFIPNLSKFHCTTPSISPTVTIFVPKNHRFAPATRIISSTNVQGNGLIGHQNHGSWLSR